MSNHQLSQQFPQPYFYPLILFDASIKELQWLEQVVNDMRYNPERYASKAARKDADFINRVEEKQRLLKMINVCNKDEKDSILIKSRI